MADRIQSGTLYVVSTPIGNLADISFRAVSTLKEVDLIAAEDTRTTSKLLSHYNIETPLSSYHKHNISTKTDKLVNELLAGKNIAIVSDAGTPGISDPGSELIKACIANSIAVTGVPGANAMLNALVISGLPTYRFVFEGFLPRQAGNRRKLLEQLKMETRTICFYESPYRLLSALRDIHDIFGNRKSAVVREATKMFEEVIRGELCEIIDIFQEKTPKGEFVIIIEGMQDKDASATNDISNAEEILISYLNSGCSERDAVKNTASDLLISKRSVYQYMLKLKGDRNEKI